MRAHLHPHRRDAATPTRIAIEAVAPTVVGCIRPGPRPWPPSRQLPTETLDRYTGRYRYTDNIALNVTREGDLLVANLGRMPDRYQLFAESETEFFLKTADAQAEFVVSRAGEVRGLNLRYNNQSFFAERLRELRE
jgi:hypothetical protein